MTEQSQALSLEEKINRSPTKPGSRLVKALCAGLIGFTLAATPAVETGCASPVVPVEFSPDSYEVPEGKKYPITIIPPENCLNIEASFGRRTVLYSSGRIGYDTVRFLQRSHELPAGTYKLTFRCMYQKGKHIKDGKGYLCSLDQAASIAGPGNAASTKKIQDGTRYSFDDGKTIVILSWEFSVGEDGQVKAADKLVVEGAETKKE